MNSRRHRRALIETFESRILYSADPGPAGIVAAVLAGSAHPGDGATAIQQGGTELVFVDARVPDVQQLLDDLSAQQQAGRPIEVVVVGSDEDGIGVIGAALAGRSDVSAVHVIGHGASGVAQLGASELDAESVFQRAGEIAGWGDALSADADLLLYGCDVGDGAAGQSLVATLAQLTGADVAASDDPTGSALFGGDWDLEVRTGAIEATPFASANLQVDWSGVLALTTQGAETLVNTTTTGTQTENWSAKTVAMDANGNYVVIWMDGSGATDTGIGIYGQRYNASGVAQGAQFHVNTYTTDNQRNPAVAMDANGNFVVVWESNSQDGSSYGIYAQRYNSSGVAQGSEFRVNTTTTYDQIEASVAMDANGNFVVAWQSWSQDLVNTNGIYAQRYNSSGVAQGSEFLVNTYTTESQTEPSVAMDASGNFVIAWQSFGQDGDNEGIYAKRYNSSGVVQGSEFHVSTYTTSNQDLPVVAMDSTGNFVVVWESNQDGSGNGIYGQRYNSSGAAQGGEFRINTTTTNQQQNPVVTMLAGGAFAVTWQSYAQDGSFDGVYMRQYDSSGTALTAETLVNTTTTDYQDVPSIAADEKGHLVVVWHGNGPGDTDGVFMQRYQYAVAPVLTLTGYSGTYVENAGVIYDAGATVTDADTTTFTGGQLIYQITANGTASDELGIRNQGTGAGLIGLSGTNVTYGGITIGTYSGSFGNGSTPLTVTFNSNASVAAVQALVRNVTYRNTSENPSTATRTISLTVSDGTGLTSVPAVVSMAVTAVNDAPTVTSAASASVAENTTAVMTVTSSDVDGGTPVYSISGGVDAAKFTINSSTGALSFSSAPDYEAPTDSGANNVYNVTVQVSDGAGGTASQAIAVTVTDVSSALVVTTTADTNDTGLGSSFTAEQLNASKGTDGKISLREAIIAANTTAGTDTISFNIADALVSGTHTIKPTSALPTLTGAVIIDGTTEPDYVVGRPVVEIDGSLTGSGVHGLVLGAGAGGSTIRGLAINSFNSSNGYALYLMAGADNNVIEGNIIGLDADGTTAVPTMSNFGVYVASSGNTIGGTTTAARNVLSNNVNAGVALYGSNNVVIGNYIGTDATGTLARGNGNDGADVYGGANNRVGGTTAAERNIISGNLRNGIEVSTGLTGTLIQGNYIGTDVTGTLSLGNNYGGIWVGSSSTGVTIGGAAAGAGNTIVNNPTGGIYTDASSVSFSLLGNTFYNNANLAIDLNADGVTANDAGDADTGPNSLQNFPVIATARIDGAGHLALVGTLASTASSYYRIEFYANATQDASGYGEGQRYLGYVNVATDGSGNASFNTVLAVSMAVGESVTATATKSNAAYSSYTDTSEFAADVMVSVNQLPVVTTTGSTLAYTENGAATAVDGALTVSDSDSPNLSGATVSITSGFASGQDTLAFTDQSGITGSWNGVTGVLTLSGSATVASYQAALRSVTYVNTSEQPATATRTVSFAVNDGLGTSATATRNISVASVDDAPSFNAADYTVTTAPGAAADRGYATLVQGDGKILVAGYSSNGSNLDFLLMRYNVDGTLDTSFGGGDGMVTTAIGSGDDEAHAVALQSDGRILVAGFTQNGLHRDFALVRYLADGTLDTSFGGGDGIVTTDIGSSSTDEAWSMVVQTDGRIVLGGTSANDFAVVRYLADGSLDTSFSGDGKATADIAGATDTGYGLALQSDGKLVQSGSATVGATLDFGVVRYNTDGSLDTSFGGGDGVVTTPVGSSFDVAQSVAIQSDGKIVVGGYFSNGSNNDIAVVRYTSTGAIDTGFGGGDGITTVDLGGHDASWGLTLQSDAKIVVVGGASSTDLAAVRLLSDGSLDTSFSGDGKLTAHLGNNSFLYSAAIGADGRVVATGYSNTTTDDGLLVRFSSDGQFDTRANPAATSLGGSASYTENGSAVVIDSSVRIFDAELNPADSYAGATLTLARSGGANAQDVFSASGNLGTLTQGGSLLLSGVNVGTVTTNSSGTLLLTFNASATQVRINEVMSSVAYANSSDAPPASVTLGWTFSDGNSGGQGTGGAKTATGTSTINITAVNDAPVITSSASASVAENTTAVMTVTSTDVDGGTPVYSIAGGGDAAKFTINSSTGVLSFVSAPDYEAPTDSGANNVYNVSVQVSDGVGYSAMSLAVTVTDVSSALVVTTTADTNDTGLGSSFTAEQLNASKGTDGKISLREAIIAANTTAGTDTVSFNIAGSGPHTLVLASALPTITDAVTIDGTTEPDYAGAPVVVLDGNATVNEGLTIEASNSTVRGLAINNFAARGVLVTNGAANTLIAGNYIGTDATGLVARGNGSWGIDLIAAGTGTVIGGTTALDRNVIASNVGQGGIAVNGTQGATITGNYIGVGADGSTALGNMSGILLLGDTTGTRIGGVVAGAGNVIANNAGEGVMLWSATSHAAILGNAFYNNAGQAIDLNWNGTVEANDAGDADTGPNQLQNFPVISSAITNGATQIIIAGSLNSEASSYYRIEFYANPAADSNGYGEGRTYLGSTNVITDASGNASFNVTLSGTVAGGASISATATRSDATYTSFSYTSEFAANITAVASNSPPSGTDGSVSATEDTTYTFATTDFGFTDANGNALLRVWIDTLPAAGTLRLNGSTFAAGTGILASDISAGRLTYQPVANSTTSTSLTFRVQDDGGTVNGGQDTDASANTLTINITAVNDAPVITSGATASVAENTTAVLTVTSTDVDGGTPVYSISGGVDAAKFSINSSTGALSFATAPDYESPTDSGANNVYNVTVQVSDGAGGITTQAVAVTVTAVNDNTPVITSAATANVAENTTAVMTVTATDADLPAQTLTYSIVGGADSARFSINASTGALSFATAPNYESPTDSGSNNIYDVTVQVSDGSLTSTRAIAVTVTPVNESAPVITSNGGGASASVSIAENTLIVASVTATDADLPGDTLTYDISGGVDAAKFAIDSNTGVLQFIGAPDYENPTDSGANNVYNVTVRVSDGTNTDTQAIAVTVTNVVSELIVTTAADTADGNTSSIANLIANKGADGKISLREAIIAANNTAGADTITFAIGSGAQTINLTSALPTITSVINIEGDSQAGFTGEPVIALNGASAGASAIGLLFSGSGTAGSSVKYLAISNFTSSGIRIENTSNVTVAGNYIGTNLAGTAAAGNQAGVVIYNATNNLIGGTTVASRNVISGNTVDGVQIFGASATGNVVSGNYIGLDATGTVDLGNTNQGVAIFTGATNNTIGGTTAGARNVISGNNGAGVLISDSGTNFNTIAGNYIGTNAAGNAAIGNTQQGVLIDTGSGNVIGGSVAGAGNVISGNLDNGVVVTNGGVNNYVQGNIVGLDESGTTVIANGQEGVEVAAGASGTWIGGATAATRNIIAGNTWQGIGVYGATTDGTVIRGNWIGVAADGTTARGNEKQGILVIDATNTMIGGSSAGEGNIIANAGAGHQGVVISGASTGAVMIGNSIYANSSLGIDVGGDWITANDTGDADTGANNLQNTPVLTSASTTGSAITITGTLNSVASTHFRIEFFANPTPDSSGYGEGQTYLGFVDVLTDASGNASFSPTITAAVPTGQVVTATATRLTSGMNFVETSEFAADVYTNPPAITSNGGGSTAGVSVAENTTAVTTVAATDPDGAAQTLTYSLAGGADQAKFQINGSTGALSFLVAPNFEAPTDADSNNVYEVIVQVGDGTGATDTQTINVTVTNANDAPVISFVSGNANYPENAGPVLVAASATVTDEDGGNFDTGRLVVQFTANGQAEDRIAIRNQGTGAGQIGISGSNVTYGGVVIGTWAGGTNGSTPLVVTFNASANAAVAQALGRNITYENVSDNPSTAVRTMAGYLEDGDGGTSNTASGTITMVPANDAPTITSAATASVAENTTAVLTVTSSDPDGGTPVYSIVGGADAAKFSINSSTGALSFLSAPNFEAPTDAGGNNVYDVTVQAADGAGGTTSQAIAVTVTNVNEAPAVTITPATYAATEQTTLTLSGTGLSVVDVDAGAATLRATLSVVSGTLTVGVGTTGVTVVSGSGSASVVLEGSQAQLNDLLAGNAGGTISYIFGGDAPPATDTLSLNVNDLGSTGSGGAASGADSATINLTAVNDAPVNTMPGAQTTSVNTALTFGTATSNPIAISDADAAGATMQVSLTITNGTFTLSSTSGLSFTTGDGTSDAAMTFTGTIAAINAALDGASFIPTTAYSGDAAIAILTGDLGNTGGGALTDSDTIHIQVGASRFQEGVSGYTGTQDTYVQDTTPTTAYGTATTVLVDDGSPQGQGLLRFDNLFGSGVGQIPFGATITSASLSFYVTNHDAADTVYLHRMFSAWTEASTWNSLDSGIQTNNTEASTTATLSFSAGVSGWNTLTGLESTVQAWADGATNNGWAFLTINPGADNWTFASSEYATVSLRPYLVINYEAPIAPVITSNGGGASASVSIAENTSAVTTVTATDADSTASELSYSIVGGADAAKFTINSSTGALSFLAAPNYEAPTDSGGN
ncbi:cadherin domain-containing protein, partial [Zoogloea oryzae]|uniref:cadherin domain-containing protein n=1 Tax=Zoogloea oryzae TaxID=310767 RepID=UPI0024E0D2AC